MLVRIGLSLGLLVGVMLGIMMMVRILYVRIVSILVCHVPLHPVAPAATPSSSDNPTQQQTYAAA